MILSWVWESFRHSGVSEWVWLPWIESGCYATVESTALPSTRSLSNPSSPTIASTSLFHLGDQDIWKKSVNSRLKAVRFCRTTTPHHFPISKPQEQHVETWLLFSIEIEIVWWSDLVFTTSSIDESDGETVFNRRLVCHLPWEKMMKTKHFPWNCRFNWGSSRRCNYFWMMFHFFSASKSRAMRSSIECGKVGLLKIFWWLPFQLSAFWKYFEIYTSIVIILKRF